MIATAVHHVSLSIDDLDAALDFYCGVLGLEKIPRPEMGIAGAWLAAGDTQIHLIVPPAGVDVGRPPEKMSPIAGHLAFQIQDYDATLAKLEAAGLAPLAPGGARGQMWVTDPSGNVIELTTGA